MSKRRWYWLGLMGITLLAFWLRLHGLFANSFHADEALFASWARHVASWKDPLLLTQAVDKPPLLFYIQALFYLPSGPVEWAARLPNFMVSVWLVPLTAVLYRRLYLESIASPRAYTEGGETAGKHPSLFPASHFPAVPPLLRATSRINLLISALIVACSPLAIQFSATAFTDPLLTFWLITSLSVIRNPYSVFRKPITDHRSPITSGLFLGLAIATKYQAVLFLPLVIGVGWQAGYGRAQWQRWLVGVLPVLTAVFLWDVARTGSWSLWSAQIGNYGGVRLSWSWELGPRLLAWGHLWVTAVPPILLFLLLLLLVGLVWRAFRVDDAASRVDLLLVSFIWGYVGLHWLTAVPVWDRYLLPLVPLVGILIGRGFSLIFADFFDNKTTSQSAFIRVYPRPILLFFIIMVLLVPAWGARYGRYPVGGQANADQGAAQIAALLADEPYGTVLYDHWYSWHWGYHLFYRKVYVSWFPHGAALAEDLAVFGRDGHKRYVALPDGAISHPIIRTIHTAGFQLQPVAVADNIALYQILPDEVTR